jgi:hypothetical protein
MPNIGDIITISNDKKYVVANLTNYSDSIYCYLVNLNNEDDTSIALYKETSFEIVNDESLIAELEEVFASNFGQ